MTGLWNQADDLFATAGEMSGADLDSAMEALEHRSSIRGLDFLPTDSHAGLLDPLPDWLIMELAPTGNPPELEAKMTPEVYPMWQERRHTTYRLRTDTPWRTSAPNLN